MSASNYLEDAIANHIFGGPNFTRPANVYISLHTGDPGETGANSEVSSGGGSGYARAAVVNNDTNFPASSGGVKSNGTDITFAEPLTGWGVVSYFAVWDTVSGGNCLVVGALGAPKTINAGDEVVIPAGALDVTVT